MLDFFIALLIVLFLVTAAAGLFLAWVASLGAEAAVETGKDLKKKHDDMTPAERQEFYEKTESFLDTAEKVTRAAADVAENFENSKNKSDNAIGKSWAGASSNRSSTRSSTYSVGSSTDSGTSKNTESKTSSTSQRKSSGSTASTGSSGQTRSKGRNSGGLDGKDLGASLDEIEENLKQEDTKDSGKEDKKEEYEDGDGWL